MLIEYRSISALARRCALSASATEAPLRVLTSDSSLIFRSISAALNGGAEAVEVVDAVDGFELCVACAFGPGLASRIWRRIKSMSSLQVSVPNKAHFDSASSS